MLRASRKVSGSCELPFLPEYRVLVKKKDVFLVRIAASISWDPSNDLVLGVFFRCLLSGQWKVSEKRSFLPRTMEKISFLHALVSGRILS